MDCFNTIEALIEAGGASAVAEARALLSQFKGSSQALSDAVDEFLLELMTLAFLLEAGREAFHHSARRSARIRLSRVKLLLS
ncbi:hypothetical protein [Mesorhizobium sp. B1-1-8]|uniref:hypothetical protein n=1 Tax=Mesorhizobium sp. B1-1-8 TaxID=2589976 RepID=UPI001D00A36B|nr:hypothetical protein [Mesorhizobium sp. B1-1-8]UCI10549.1 hypothetical protein FJ974_30090 [Mesorhizobium sp. B1-1-8]